jgi:RND family efflux transporter MFP subunit
MSTGRTGTLAALVVVPNAQMRVIAAPVGGMVEMLAVAPGSTVKRGQVVAHLASPQALELQRDALQSGSQAQLQQQNLQRDEQLFAEGLIAESRLQSTRAAARQANAQASERRQGLAMAGVSAGKLGGPLVLTAPIDGVVLEQGAQLGQRVEAATLIYRIARLSPLWLEIQAPQEIAAGLREGMSIKLARQAISGKLISIGRAVDAASQTILLRASVTQGAEQLNPGQVVEVEIAGEASGPTENTVHTLPASALLRHQGATLVFVRSPGKESSFLARPVRIIKQSGDSIQVEGLKADEVVVTQGVSSLKSMLTAAGTP